MASEYAKNKALIKKLKEPKIPNVDFKLGDPQYYYDPVKNRVINNEEVYLTEQGDFARGLEKKPLSEFQDILPRLQGKKKKKTVQSKEPFKFEFEKEEEPKKEIPPKPPEEPLETMIAKRARESFLRDQETFRKVNGDTGLAKIIGQQRYGFFENE